MTTVTKKQAKAIRKIALGTIKELDRRGWTQHDLAKTRIRIGEEPRVEANGYEWMKIIYQDIPMDVAQVCLLGAASSAYNPFYPEDPGMSYSEHPDYEAFLRAVLAELPKAAQAYVKREEKGPYPSGEAVSNAIAEWNDKKTRTLKQVKAVLQAVAEKHAPTPAAPAE